MGRFVVSTEWGYVVLSAAKRGGFNVSRDIDGAYKCSRSQADVIASRVEQYGYSAHVIEVEP